ncbi:MAG: hypothetical protein DDT26_00430 [Dehalococcoidia bacterium]|nr:hypothetical protein [Chloroflexota bacterium]
MNSPVNDSGTNSNKKVIFSCTGNINRSAAAHAIALMKGATNVASAGTSQKNAGRIMNKKMRRALDRAGFVEAELPVIRSTPLTAQLLDEYDSVVCMASVHWRNIIRDYGMEYSGKLVMFRQDGLDVPDPHFSKESSAYDEVVTMILANLGRHISL